MESSSPRSGIDHETAEDIAVLLPFLKRRAKKFYPDDPEGAEELAAETCLLAVRKSSLFQRGTNLKAWLLTLMRNTYIDCWRRSKRERSISVDDLPEEVFAADMTDLLWEEKAALGRAINRLPRHQAAIMERVLYHGLCNRETAAEMGVPVGTVLSGRFRAQHALRGHIIFEMANG